MSHFTPELFAFLSDLRANNDRDWFLANKKRYEAHLRQPFMHFMSDLAPRMREISPHIRVDPRPNGGSLFRIHRDVRFSKNKEPYKTHAGAQFRHELAKDVHAPGYYLHLEPGGVFAAGGMWHPPSQALRAVRDAIVAAPQRWSEVMEDEEFSELLPLSGESLQRGPAGYDKDHPLIEDLKRKDFVFVQSFHEEDTLEDDFLDRYVESCAVAAPFMRFLCEAVGVDF